MDPLERPLLVEYYKHSIASPIRCWLSEARQDCPSHFHILNQRSIISQEYLIPFFIVGLHRRFPYRILILLGVSKCSVDETFHTMGLYKAQHLFLPYIIIGFMQLNIKKVGCIHVTRVQVLLCPCRSYIDK